MEISSANLLRRLSDFGGKVNGAGPVREGQLLRDGEVATAKNASVVYLRPEDVLARPCPATAFSTPASSIDFLGSYATESERPLDPTSDGVPVDQLHGRHRCRTGSLDG